MLLRRIPIIFAVTFLLVVIACGQQKGVERGEGIPVTPSTVLVPSPRPRSALPFTLKSLTRPIEVLADMYPSTTTVTVPEVVEHAPQQVGGNDWPMFEALAICETGLNWNHESRDYVSAFGMARTTFNMGAHALGLPDWHPGYPPADQLRIARYGHYSEGWYWGCGSKVSGW